MNVIIEAYTMGLPRYGLSLHLISLATDMLIEPVVPGVLS